VLPISVFAVSLLRELLASRNAFRASIACGVAVVVLCYLDVRTFEHYWVQNKGYDPVTYFLLGTREMVPFRPR
jgi:hypothetical protein